MSKLALSVISTDWHIKLNNTEQIKDLIQQQIDVAKGLETTNLICLGDVFQSRQAQPLATLKCFEEILDLIDKSGMILYCIPGNHDKTNYESDDSFLDQFSWHPALKLTRHNDKLTLDEGLRVHLLPYFEESKWVDKLGDVNLGLLMDGKNILMSHQALTGSMNNDSSKVENSIKPSLFKDFYKVFLGHYHNQQQVGKNIFHLPSLQANNFGEDNDKGFTVLYNDGSHELVNSKFPQYHTIKLDLDKLDKQGVNSLKKQAAELIKESGFNVRFKIEGSEDKVNSLKTEEFSTLGIDIKKEHKSVIKSIEKAETGETITYDDETILKKFDEFCKQEDYSNIEYGKNLLIKKLKK